MAKLYALDGALIRLLKNAQEEAEYGPPDAYDEMLAFDADTNPQIVAALSGEIPNVRWQDASLVDGVLYYNDEPVTVNPPGQAYEDREYLRDWWAALNNALDNVGAAITQTEQAETNWPTLTSQQKQQWLLDHFDEVLGGLALALRVIFGMLRFVRWLVRGPLENDLRGLE